MSNEKSKISAIIVNNSDFTCQHKTELETAPIAGEEFMLPNGIMAQATDIFPQKRGAENVLVIYANFFDFSAPEQFSLSQEL